MEKGKKVLTFDVNDYDSQKTLQLLTILGHKQTKFIVSLVSDFLKITELADKTYTREEAFARLKDYREKKISIPLKEIMTSEFRDTIFEAVSEAVSLHGAKKSSKPVKNKSNNGRAKEKAEEKAEEKTEEKIEENPDDKNDVDDDMAELISLFL